MTEFDEKQLAFVGEKLISNHHTIAVAESVTGGLLQFALSGIIDAATFYQGGITAYNISQKCRLLSIDPYHAMQVNCVSDQVAFEMASNVSLHFNSDWGIGITGYATPVPESNQLLFAYYCITYHQEVISKGKFQPNPGHPRLVQQYYVNSVVQKLLSVLQAQKF